MVLGPQAHVRRAPGSLLGAARRGIAGHSTHIFHGIASRVIFDLGDFLDEHIVRPKLRKGAGVGPVDVLAVDRHGIRVGGTRDEALVGVGAVEVGATDRGSSGEVVVRPVDIRPGARRQRQDRRGAQENEEKGPDSRSSTLCTVPF
jgi:hypothetical protein